MEAAAGCSGNRREVERLCRLCATITTHPNQRVDIFAVDGLRSKIETCLPVLVSKDSLLPDTLCTVCNDKVCSFFNFRKRSLETLKILEENFHVVDSCFVVPKQLSGIAKSEKSTATDNLLAERTQFDEWRCKTLANFHYDDEDITSKQEKRRKLLHGEQVIEKANAILAQVNHDNKLVEYDDSEVEEEEVTSGDRTKTTISNKLYFDDKVNDIINEIQERKSTKRKLEALFDDCARQRSKIFKPSLNLSELFPGDGSNRRKKRPPAKRHLQAQAQHPQVFPLASGRFHHATLPPPPSQLHIEPLPQVCLLCDQQFPKGTLLAKHVFDTHGIDMAQVLSSEPIPEGMTRTLHANLQHLQQNMQHNLQNTQIQQTVIHPEYEPNLNMEAKSPGSPKSSAEKKKKLPELVKITDLKTKRESIEMKVPDDAPPTLTASYVCPLCPASLTNKTDLYAHLRIRHAQHAKLICGLCLHIATSVHSLQEHLDTCTKSHAIVGYFVCQVCKYAEDNQKSLENHILVHDFLLSDCKKDGKIFDPSDFMDTNEACEQKFYSCTECGSSLQSFKEYSSHKRSEHSIFHCDLCNKSYGRNSHLWKHVNRVHKGHPSVTCQFCYKTSASKYHLLQHFNKIHTQKSGSLTMAQLSAASSAGATHTAGGGKVKNGEALSEFEEDDFLMKKFDPFDFQSVRQSFMRAEMEAKKGHQSQQESSSTSETTPTIKKVSKNTEMRDLSSLKMPTVPPKELDSSSTIYTNIITNYTPPTNDGEYKCPKCSKAFHKRTLLKKHKKNCRPRLQKDLLTRCKSCSRIFKDRQSLAKHLVNYHSEYSCEMCNEKVQSKCEIVSHIRFTHPGCHLNCRDCGNVLRNNDLLRAHLQDHANSFVCQFCGDILPSKIKLKMHILSLHRKILSLSCGVCLKLFESQHILRDHVRMVHREALQPLTSCTVCGKNYGSKWKTYDHLNKSHGRVFRACKVCLEVFNNEQELQAHVDMHHSKGMKKYVPAETLAAFEMKEPSQSHHSDLEEESDVEVEDGIKDEFEGKSILEKHLVGAYALPQQHRSNNNSTKPNGLTTTTMPPTSPMTPPSNKNSKQQQHTEELINSSKRTVYVNSNDPSVCDICHKNWPAKKHLWQHYIRCHKQVAATVCGICLCTNKSYADLQRHLNMEHPTLLHGKGFGSNFICRICGRYHNASSKLKLHMAIHIKFDWSLLDNPANHHQSGGGTNQRVKKEELKTEPDDDNDYEDEEDDDEEEDDEEEQMQQENLKFKVKIKPPQKNEEVNFESMIEQIECSTNSSSSSESDDGDAEGEEEGEDGEEEGEEATGENDEDDDEAEEDDEEDGEAEDEEYDEQAVQQQVEEEEEVEEMSEDDEEDEEDEDDEGEKEDEAEEETDVQNSSNISEREESQEQDEEEIEEEDEDSQENEEVEEEYEEVVEEVVHQDDMTIYEQEEIIENMDSYLESDEEGCEQIVHIVSNQLQTPHAQEYQVIDDDADEESSSSLSQEVIYDSGQVTYVQEDAGDVDSAVQSICYEEDDSCHDGNVAEEYEVQSTNAPGMNNQHEIQSAVDSIL